VIHLLQGQASDFSTRIPELVWAEDPALIGLEFQSYEKWADVCKSEWPQNGASNCHDATTLAWDGADIVGLINAFPAAEMEPRFEKSETLRGPSHLPIELIEQIDALFAEPDADAFYILDISVHASEQKKGVGEKLIAHAEQIGARNGCKSLALHVSEDNPAVGFYERLGFAQTGRCEVPELQKFGISSHSLMARQILQ
jgi:GNAT superfamily N-acetyltransferase